MPRPNFVAILHVLVGHKVEFIVVGGVGAVLQGAPVTTFDLDIVHSTEPANVERLLAALDSLDACYRMQPERRSKPQTSHLASSGHQLLMTRHGPLDLLGAIGHGHQYSELIQKAIAVQIAEGVTVPVLELSSLIAIKEETAGEKDRAVLPILRQTLRERQ
jgi:predicted nucleotidyltransferase